MNTLLNVMSNTEITLALVPLCLIIAVVAIYRTAVANKKQEQGHH